MFEDAIYYVSLETGDRRHAALVFHMNFPDFFHEYRSRNGGRNPYIVSMTPLDSDEGAELEDQFNNSFIYDGR